MGKDQNASQALKSANAIVLRNRHEARFWRDILALNLPIPEREYRFAAIHVGLEGPGIRKRIESAGLKDWRFDFAWPKWRLAFEIEGAPGCGRHTTARGFIEDCEKYSEAQLLGWTVYRVPGDWVQAKNLRAINLLRRVLDERIRWECDK